MEEHSIEEFFTEVIPGRVACKKCKAHNKLKFFSADRSKTMMNHLLKHHGLLVNVTCRNGGLPLATDQEAAKSIKLIELKVNALDNSVEHIEHDTMADDKETVVLQLSDCRPLKKRRCESVRSLVLKHFCHNTLSKEINKEPTVYCIHCLNQNTITRYRDGTSATSLKYHLTSKHNIDPVVILPPDNINTNEELIEKIIILENSSNLEQVKAKRHRKTINNAMQMSKVRHYFRWIDDTSSCYCILCAEEDVEQVYNTRTSTTSLRNHLLRIHNVDPELVPDENLPTLKLSLPEEIRQIIKEHISINTTRTLNYFIKLPNEGDILFCIFCLDVNIKQMYTPTTSVSNLKKHLQMRHNHITPILKDTESGELVVVPSRAELDLNLNENIINIAAKRAQTTNHRVQHYFMRIGDDDDGFYCVFCLSKHIKYRYNFTTSSTNMKSHLRSRHNVEIMKLKVLMDASDAVLVEELSATEYKNVFDECFSVEEELQCDNVTEIMDQETIDSSTLAENCRSCGKLETNLMTSMIGVCIDLNEHKSVLLTDAFDICTGIKVDPSDYKSKMICYVCLATLKTAYQFRMKALEIETETNDIMNRND